MRGALVSLRAFREADITGDYLGWLNDPLVTRFSNQRFRTHDRASCLSYLRSFEAGSNLFLSVQRLLDDVAIGTMTAYISPHHGTADVGILIGNRSVWGQGYGQDAWDTLLHWLLRERRIRKVTAGTLACNAAMLRLMERSGMHREAERKQQEICDGSPTDLLYYARFSDA